MENENTPIVVDILKFGLSLAVGIGAESLCGAAAGKLVAGSTMTKTEKICAGLAGGVIGGMIGERADDYISRKVDGAITKFRKIRELIKELHDDPDGEEE